MRIYSVSGDSEMGGNQHLYPISLERHIAQSYIVLYKAACVASSNVSCSSKYVVHTESFSLSQNQEEAPTSF